MPTRGVLPEDSRVTWAAVAAVVTILFTVTGGVLRVEAAMDERFEKFEHKIEAGDASVKADVRAHVKEVYARKDAVAREPVEAVEVEALKYTLNEIEDRFNSLDGKLDRLLGYSRKRGPGQ